MPAVRSASESVGLSKIASRPTRPPPKSRYPEPSRSVDPDESKGWLRRVRPVVWTQKLIFVSGILFGLLATVATVLVPLAVGRGIDAIADGDTPTPFVIALVLLAFMRFVFGFGYRFSLFRAAHRIENDLRNLIFARLTELSFSYWDRVQSGQIISRANTDIRSIQLLFAFGPLIAMQLVLLTMALAVMLVTDVALTVVALAGLPMVFVLGVSLRKRIFPLSWVAQARQAEVATIVDENIGGARVVKAFAQEEAQLQVLAEASYRLRWVGTAVADTRARFAPAMEAFPRMGLALVLWYGGVQTINGDIQIGDLVAFSTYVVLLATPFRMVGFMLLQWQRAAAAALRVFEILDEQPDIVEPDDPVRLIEPVGRIEFADVGFSYPGSDGSSDGSAVLDRVSFTIEPGETVAIVGPTGSGKSTIARLLPRFYDADSGAVRIDGHDVATLSLSDLRDTVGVVTDDPFLFDTSVYDNVAFARPAAEPHEVDAAIADAAAVDFVVDLPQGVLTEIGERGATLSGGQRQRLALARGLLADPAVLVLDDATSAIDVGVEQRIHDAVTRRRSNRTTILIAHRLSTIALADRVLLLDEGRISAAGDHYELLEDNPRYASILADTTSDFASIVGTPDEGSPDARGVR
ncbi:MAG: ABC transporter ATP-binding protein [Acidimicrobiaceae bacterium]|nr:ABC transporter ATP-binding protein [Acidimicrobiaceae bacterium]